MGAPKKVTVGYWHRLLQHWGLSKGPIDAFLEFRAGDRTAWSGTLAGSGTLTIDQEGLWGGKKSEGGISGQLDVQFGEADQPRNDYLVARLGDNQPAYRGKVTAVWRGGRWGINPYPKEAAFKIRRILKGWDNDQCWYPEKASIPLTYGLFSNLSILIALDVSGSMAGSRLSVAQAAIAIVLDTLDALRIESGKTLHVSVCLWATGRSSLSRNNCDSTDIAELKSFVNSASASGGTNFDQPFLAANDWFNDANDGRQRKMLFVTDGAPSGSSLADALATGADIIDQSSGTHSIAAGTQVDVHGFNIVLGDTSATAQIDNTPQDSVPVISDDNPNAMAATLLGSLGSLIGMNPAHILYDSLTAHDMQNEPIGMINDASFRAAADKLHAEAFGLCTTFDGSEDLEAFQQRICDVIGACLTQSRVDGQYYLDLVRGDYDLESLPVIGSDDIIDCVQEPTGITEVVNQVIVEWYDPQNAEDRATQPVQALGAIQAAGGVIGETRSYPEIPLESLALRAAARDLQARSTPLSKLTLTTNRRHWKLRPGQFFRLQFPEEGIADMVCLVGDIDTGTLTDGRLRITAVQDVFGMPDTVYLKPESGNVAPEDMTPTASPHQRLIETPYVEMAMNLSTADLAAVPADAGSIMAAATMPSNGVDYALYTAGEGEALDDTGVVGDWCPSALIVEAAGYLDTAFTLTGGTDLADVDVGSWALWDDEIVRVDAIDPVAGTLTLGRGCADTVPALHAADSRIWFCGEFGTTDEREYVDGETVTAQLPTRTGSAELPLTSAPLLSVELARRQFRPYPPAGLKINGGSYPAEIHGSVNLTWVPRDRLLQADKLIDTTAAGVGPEPGTTWSVRCYIGTTLDHSEDGLTDGGLSWTPSFSAGVARVEIWAMRDGVESLYPLSHEFALGQDLWTPAYMASLVAWLVSDNAANTLVSGWLDTLADKSGNSKPGSAYGGSADNRAQLISNGLGARSVFRRAAVIPKGAFNITPTGIARAAGGVTLVAVHRLTASQGISDTNIFRINTGAGLLARCMIGRGSYGSNYVYAGGRRLDTDSFSYVSNGADVGTDWVIIIAVFDYTSGKLTLSVNGQVFENASAFSAGITTDTAPVSIGIGHRGDGPSSAGALGDYAELMITGNAMATAERQKLEGYLAWSWGMDDRLPTGHPYKSAPPTLADL